MSYETLEKAATVEPVEIYLFTIDSQEAGAYTSGVAAVSYNGRNYVPYAISRDTIVQDVSSSADPINVRVVGTTEVALHFRQVFYQKVRLQIFRLHADDANALTLFDGWVMSVEWQGAEAILTCQNKGVALQRDGLRYKSQAPCNHILFSDPCGVVEADYTVVAVLSAVSADGLELTCADFDSHDDGWFISGVCYYDGSYRQIEGHVGDTITLSLPFESLAAGAIVQVTAGCDHSLATCKAKFDGNQINYGGFPYIPQKNPYNKGMS